MSASTGSSVSTRNFLGGLGILLIVLALFFWRSFVSTEVLFANDAPLGQLKAQEGKALSNFGGVWLDLNWLGSEQPSALPDFSNAFYLLLGAVGFAKFYAPLCLLILGLSAYYFFRSLGFHVAVSVVAALAAMLNINVFSHSCWGLPSRALAWGMALLAMGAVHQSFGIRLWLKMVLAGIAVGMGIMEAFDIGAIYSLFVAAYIAFYLWNNGGKRGAVKGISLVAVVAIVAAAASAQALVTLIGTQVQGIATLQNQEKSPQEKWDWATQWSLPKAEAIRVAIPGVFGYRLDTENGGNYWGTVGQQPGWEESHQGLARHSGAGEYAGLLTLLLAGFILARALSNAPGRLGAEERRLVFFWSGVAVLSLLLAFGRHAPFYRLIFHLPFFSTVRSPIKFMHIFHLANIILFAYGLQTLISRPLQTSTGGWLDQLARWWKNARGFEKNFAVGAGAVFGASVVGVLIYLSSGREIQRYIENHGFSAELAKQIFSFSLRELVTYLVLFAISGLALFTLLSGFFSGKRTTLGVALVGTILCLDLGRADLPWIKYYNYKERYTSNEVIDLLRKNPEEHRVTQKLAPFSGSFFVTQAGGTFVALADEWAQHLFPYYGVQSLDIIQMPRIPELDETFFKAFMMQANTKPFLFARLWELSNTRYLLGQSDFLASLNPQLDPQQQRFKSVMSFEIAPKPGRDPQAGLAPQDLTITPQSNGRFSVYEFSGALPRTKLYSHWRSLTNEVSVLEGLTSANFKPAEELLLAESISANPTSTNRSGTAKIVKYRDKQVEVEASPDQPSILLLNSKFDPHWKVFVDGKAEKLLRCNYIMQGVFLQPGTHRVSFEFRPPLRALYLSLGALAVGLIILVFLALSARTSPSVNRP